MLGSSLSYADNAFTFVFRRRPARYLVSLWTSGFVVFVSLSSEIRCLVVQY